MMMRRRYLLAIVGVCMLFVTRASAAGLEAGAARVDLTPPMEMKAALGGYGARMSRPAEGVHDPLFVKALVVSDGDRRFAVLTADILGFPPAFKSALVEQLAPDGWTSEQIMLLPSHSHTSIEMNAINPANVFGIKQIGVYHQKLFAWTIARCRSVILVAAGDLKPVTIGTSSRVIDGWNRNRRVRGGPTDKSLTVTRVDTTDGTPLAVLVNFTAHPTFMGAEHMLFSAGWPGHMQRKLEALIGHDVTVMFYNGAEGDQSPIGQSNSSSDPWEAAEQYGVGLASQATDLWGTIAPRRDVVFAYHTQPITLPPRCWHPDFMKTGGDEYGLSEKLLQDVLPLMFPGKTTSGSLRLGDLVIVGIPGELAAELGLEIKKKAREITGATHITIGGLANEWISYILSAEQYQRGGYEASVSFFGAKLGRHIVDGAVTGLKELAGSMFQKRIPTE